MLIQPRTAEETSTMDPAIPPELASHAFSLMVLWLSLLAAVVQYLFTARI